MSGTAIYFGRMGTVAEIGRPVAGGLADVQVSAPHAYAPGAFDLSLRDAYGGRSEIRLLVEHDPARELASTRDRSLLVAACDRGLGFVLMTGTRRGREAARFVRDNPHLREASIGGRFDPRWNFLIAGREPEYVAVAFMLEEISLVRHGGHPGTRVTYEELPPSPAD